MGALGEIAGALEGCGLSAEGARRARLPRLAAGLADMAAEMHEPPRRRRMTHSMPAA